MRIDPGQFAVLNQAASKSPRFVLSIEYETESLYLTSHTGITSVPGIVIDGVLQEPDAISQRIRPDEGRSEIGTLTFAVIDKDSAFTNYVRNNLQTDNEGVRLRTARFFVGYEGLDFTGFVLFQTQVIKSVSYDKGIYRVSCNDITREQKKDIFEPKTTTLRDSITATATTVPVYLTTGFSTIVHGTSWSDAPSATVLYIRIDKEIIRATGTTSDSFTGCTRGALNTKAVAHEVDPAAEAERRPKVEEVIYLELPALKMALAVMTGTLYGSANVLPSHWNLGIDAALVRDADFAAMTDLWTTADDAAGFILRFQDLKKIDGKKFLESEIFQPTGVYQVIYSDGDIGLKRMNQVLSDAAHVVTIDDDRVTEIGELQHDLDGMINNFVVDWSWDGQEFKRRSAFIDQQSVGAHRASKLKVMSFKGVHGSRHTDSVIRKRLDAFRDRYAEPPERITISALPSFNPIEIGDIVLLRLLSVRDYAGSLTFIQRAFEVQHTACNFRTGRVTLELFGSTARASVESPTTNTTALPDAFYNSSGVALSTVVTMIGNVTQPGTFNLAGNADLNNSAAIYYHLGDLEIGSSTILTSNLNVQLRVRGFVTVNGDIDGVGRGKTGVADNSSINSAVMGTPGFLGNARGMDGVKWWPSVRGTPFLLETRPARLTQGQYASFPFLELSVVGNTLVGLPSDLRGTSGGPGEKVINVTNGVAANGGTGADSGAGIAIICRGLSFGASGSINLSGNSSAATSLSFADSYPGSGGAGCPGGLFIGLDGGALSLPDVGGRFTGATGTVPIQGNPMGMRERHQPQQTFDQRPYAGYLDEAYISALDMSNAAHRIQYIPAPQTATPDASTKPPAPTALVATGGAGFIAVRVTLPDFDTFDIVEVFASIDNNRANSVKIGEGRQAEFKIEVPPLSVRYFWSRVRRVGLNNLTVVSEWFPSGATSGVGGISLESPSAVFLDTFEHQDWASAYELISGSGFTITYPTDGEFSGRVIQAAGGQFWIQSRANLPYDANTLYRIEARVRRTAAGSGGAGTQLCWVGVSGVAANGTTYINESGSDSPTSQHYNCIRGLDLSGVALDTWVTAVGYFRGHATSGFGVAPHIDAPTPLYTGVRFFRPLLILNYNGGNGTQQCDYIRVERLTSPDDSDNSLKKRLAPDAEFSFSTDQFYWYTFTNGGSAPSISLTGGNVAGRASMTGDSNQKQLVSRRIPAQQAVNGEVYTVTMRWRRTGTITGTGGAVIATLIRHAREPAANLTWSNTDAFSQVGGIALLTAELNAATVDEWQEMAAVSLVVPQSGYGGGDLPWISVEALMNGAVTGGTIEIDLLDATPGNNGQQRRRTYTGTSTLSLFDLMNEVVYDSASAGTLTIPNGAHTLEGARVFFHQVNTGLLTISAASGSLLSPPNTSGNRAVSGRYARAYAEARGGNWYLSGDL